MTEFADHFDTPEDAYRGFFRADSAMNAEAWAAVMSYPHVRVSARGRLAWYDTAGEYADGADWAPRIATGWVRSEGIEPVRLHTSARKVHLQGGWTRYNAAGEPILENRVTYVLTRPAQSWGIQARFGVDSFTGDDDDETAAAAADVVAGYLGADESRLADLCRFPLIVVGVGEVWRAEDAAGVGALGAASMRGGSVREVRAAQTGSDGAVVAVAVERADGVDHAIVVAGRRQGRWEVAGISPLAWNTP